MDVLFWIAIENAAAALVLAIPVAALGLVLRRPALLHALWVIVLLKLITPPVIRLPLALPRLPEAAPPASRSEAVSREIDPAAGLLPSRAAARGSVSEATGASPLPAARDAGAISPRSRRGKLPVPP